MNDPFLVWERWLESHDGRLFRRREGGNETDLDLVAMIPNPPGSAIVTVGDLKALIRARE